MNHIHQARVTQICESGLYTKMYNCLMLNMSQMTNGPQKIKNPLAVLICSFETAIKVSSTKTLLITVRNSRIKHHVLQRNQHLLQLKWQNLSKSKSTLLNFWNLCLWYLTLNYAKEFVFLWKLEHIERWCVVFNLLWVNSAHLKMMEDFFVCGLD